MLGKLAYRNTKRNIKDYLIYLITVTASFSLIFAFNLVANSDEIVKLCSSMDAFKNSLFAVNILIIFVICFLINYTTKFMFEKRSKELGTYMLLGIKKKEIAHLVVIENILLGILAFVLAIPIGFLFSQFVSLVIVNLLGIPKTLFISLNFVSIGLLIIYFLTIYVLVLLNLLRRISKMTIRDFLYFDKQNEKKMFRDSKKRNVIFVLSIILGAISLFLWNSRCTMDNFNKQETLTYLMVSVIMLIISIYGISTTCADMFLTVLLKNKKMKYQNDNLFVARTFASKARTMSFTFGTLSMLILTSLLALNYSSINKASYDISVNLNAPYDVQLFDDKQVFDEYIRVIEEEYTIDNTIEYDIYKEPNHQVQNFFQSEYYDFDPVLKLSDYNRLLELRKMPLLSLNDNEYYIVTNSKFAYEVEDNKDIETITVANKNLKLKGYDTKSYWNSITNTGRFVVVLPDKYVQGLEVSENHLIIDTKEETDAELENKIKEDMQHQLVKVDKNGEINDESYRVNVRGAEIEQQKAMVAIVVSLFMYIAFILISAVGTILAVQSLSDSTKYKYRYLTLRRLGINDKSLFKTIRKQLLILFCVPAISAILCSFVMMSSLNNVYQQILGDKHLYLIYFGLNLIIFFLIYSIYWIMVNQGGVEMRIAIIEDDEITRLELSKLLNTQGYETVLLTDFGNLTDELKQYSIELVLLDINLPYENGYEVCRKIKQVMPVPIIFVTSRDTNADELKSIQVGGIDFITKPYDTLILLEKIKRALQLSNPNNFRELVKKDCTLDLHLSILKYQEQSIELTRNEFRILYYFFMNEDKVISKEELLEKLWNDKYYIDENVLLVNMTRLKKKMKEIGIVHLLENIRGKGWKL